MLRYTIFYNRREIERETEKKQQLRIDKKMIVLLKTILRRKSERVLSVNE